MITKYIIIGLVITIALMGAGSAWYFKYSQAKIGQLEQDKATAVANTERLKGEVKVQNDTINRIEAQRAEDQTKILKLSQQHNAALAEVGDLRKKFARHDLNHLSLRKPGLIEKIINRGTAKVNKEFEELTAPPQEVVVPEEAGVVK